MRVRSSKLNRKLGLNKVRDVFLGFSLGRCLDLFRNMGGEAMGLSIQRGGWGIGIVLGLTSFLLATPTPSYAQIQNQQQLIEGLRSESPGESLQQLLSIVRSPADSAQSEEFNLNDPALIDALQDFSNIYLPKAIGSKTGNNSGKRSAILFYQSYLDVIKSFRTANTAQILENAIQHCIPHPNKEIVLSSLLEVLIQTNSTGIGPSYLEILGKQKVVELISQSITAGHIPNNSVIEFIGQNGSSAHIQLLRRIIEREPAKYEYIAGGDYPISKAFRALYKLGGEQSVRTYANPKYTPELIRFSTVTLIEHNHPIDSAHVGMVAELAKSDIFHRTAFYTLVELASANPIAEDILYERLKSLPLEKLTEFYSIHAHRTTSPRIAQLGIDLGLWPTNLPLPPGTHPNLLPDSQGREEIVAENTPQSVPLAAVSSTSPAPTEEQSAAQTEEKERLKKLLHQQLSVESKTDLSQTSLRLIDGYFQKTGQSRVCEPIPPQRTWKYVETEQTDEIFYTDEDLVTLEQSVLGDSLTDLAQTIRYFLDTRSALKPEGQEQLWERTRARVQDQLTDLKRSLSSLKRDRHPGKELGEQVYHFVDQVYR